MKYVWGIIFALSVHVLSMLLLWAVLAASDDPVTREAWLVNFGISFGGGLAIWFGLMAPARNETD